jgi:hypothetical protein|uniref:ATP synthase F0 subunit 4 n=1 Tax=Baffinella frigidus TaxID=2571260 RepID=A0A6C0X6P5_9CRYP|nr:ATP synthase F0 subunit 4 [Cryptophyta sp. CCMP2293]
MIFNLYVCSLFIVLISKEFIIFNEEILVLFAFGFFIHLVVIGIGQVSGEELIMRGNKIKGDFDFYKNLQTKGLSYLINYNEKQQELSQELKKNSLFLYFEISSIAKFYSKDFYNAVFLIGFAYFKRYISSGTKIYARGQSTLLKRFYSTNF